MAGAFRVGRTSIGGRGLGSVAGVGGIQSFFSQQIFVFAMFTLLFLATLSVLFTANSSTSSQDSDLPSTGPLVRAHVRRTFLALKSDPLKTRLNLIRKQANHHISFVNAYAAYARKLKLENSKQHRIFEYMVRNFSHLISRPSYRSALVDTNEAIDEDVLRQFEKEVKERVKLARQLVTEAKESFNNQLKIQKLKDTIFAISEQLAKAKKQGAFSSLIAAKSKLLCHEQR